MRGDGRINKFCKTLTKLSFQRFRCFLQTFNTASLLRFYCCLRL
uniref:Uncharacterized protein n=1 Tax=Arundo donax TaxID=35708 RepID=A0A0A9DYG9_ARUDO